MTDELDMVVEDMETNLDDDNEEIERAAEDALQSLLPEKSRELYEKTFEEFMTWCQKKKIKKPSGWEKPPGVLQSWIEVVKSFNALVQVIHAKSMLHAKIPKGYWKIFQFDSFSEEKT